MPGSDHPILGKLIGVYRPTTWRMWFLAVVIVAGPGSILVLAALIVNNDSAAFGGVFSNLLCFGSVGLLLVVLAAVLSSDYRAWRKSRTIVLSIYENGVVQEENGRTITCHWDEIQLTRTRWQTRSSKSGTTRQKVITALVKNDGSVIKIPETINRFAITETISELRRVPIRDNEILNDIEAA